MSIKYWVGGAAAAGQIVSFSVTAFDAATSYRVQIGHIVVSVLGNTDTATTADDLRTAIGAEPHAYFLAGVLVGGTGSDVTLTALQSGVPVPISIAAVGGTGTLSALSTDQAATGPNHFDNAENWSDGAVPGNGDTAVYAESSIDCLYGIEQSGVTLALLEVRQSYTGRIGLAPSEWRVSSSTTVADVPELNPLALSIGWDAAVIGGELGITESAGSGRLHLTNAKAGASSTRVQRTARVPETGLAQALALSFANAGADVFIESALGGVGIANLRPGDTATLGDLNVLPSDDAAVFVAEGVTLGSLVQQGGQVVLKAAATVPLVAVRAGQLWLDGGGYAVTQLDQDGGEVIDRHTHSSAEIVTLNLNAGRFRASGTREARTYTTINLAADAVLERDDALTIGTLNLPAELHQLQAVAL